ncbi:hypothetical protein [Sporolactobacillus inulinus]|uniref:Uncharacterized protein n=1 Tax=Sporolactobacillus inulinus CASD TaxID=1069536 RepID=A0A0U1QN94_9BACL|nr:hypothetical protein [Sporolactobacillus inulinus]KLI02281.1 hypothetical protein SINU_08730 [Sporolactobacillus inulinus CASD]
MKKKWEGWGSFFYYLKNTQGPLISLRDAEPAHQSGWNAHQAQDGSKPHPAEVRTKRSPVFLIPSSKKTDFA